MALVSAKFINFGTASGQVNDLWLPSTYTPVNYTPTQTGSEGNNKLSAHLKGIDQTLARVPANLSLNTNMYDDFVGSLQITTGSGLLGGGNGYIVGAFGWATNSGGGGSQVQLVTTSQDQTHMGIVELRSQAANGYAAINISSTNSIVHGGGTETIEAVVMVPTIPVATSNDFIIRVGTGDVVSTFGDNANGIYFEMNRSVSANWLCKAAYNGSITQVITGVPWTTNWTRLTITLSTSNVATFYIGGIQVGTISTNLPLNAANPVNLIFKMDRVAQTGNPYAYARADYFTYNKVYSGTK